MFAASFAVADKVFVYSIFSRTVVDYLPSLTCRVVVVFAFLINDPPIFHYLLSLPQYIHFACFVRLVGAKLAEFELSKGLI